MRMYDIEKYEHNNPICAAWATGTDLPARISSPPAAKKQPRRYGFACSTCRRRKSKCDGGLPNCQQCIHTNQKCSYNHKPPSTFLSSLQYQLDTYQDLFTRLQRASHAERDAILANPPLISRPKGGRARAPIDRQSSSEINNPERLNDIAARVPRKRRTPEQVLINTNGQICFYGRTSLYYSGEQRTSLETKDTLSPDLSDAPVVDLPQATVAERELRSFLAEVPPIILDHLLEVYWCWPHHLNYIICKPLFLRSLHDYGPYVTPFLLCALLCQAARYSSRSDAAVLGDRFGKLAVSLLATEMSRGSSLALVQGLLIFSGRECACGRSSQGWLYSGMAFHMAKDLGLHIDTTKFGSAASLYSDEELVLRRQLFWSCYTWDKTLSLCFGRAPQMTQSIPLPTVDSLMDGIHADDEPWTSPVMPTNPLTSITPSKSLGNTRFVYYCRLCTLIEDIFCTLYMEEPSGQGPHLTYLTETLERLDEWAMQSPPELIFRPEDTLKVCSPPHVLVLNIMYQTAVILLCRPFRSETPIARQRSTHASCKIDDLSTLHVRRFGFGTVTWIHAYAIFAACMVDASDLKEIDDANLRQEAGARIEFGLQILGQTSCAPSASRCAVIIKKIVRQYVQERQVPSAGLGFFANCVDASFQGGGSDLGSDGTFFADPDLPALALDGIEPSIQGSHLWAQDGIRDTAFWSILDSSDIIGSH